MKCLLPILLLLAACHAPGVHSEPDTVIYECPSRPDPVPCIRVGVALAGHADRLLDVLADGTATQIDSAADALGVWVDDYEECSATLMDEISNRPTMHE